MKNDFKIIGEKVIIYLNRKDGSVIETVIDVSQLDTAQAYSGTWYPHWNPHTKTFYVYGARSHKNGQKRAYERLHRWLMSNPKGMIVDHKNGDTLDNRLENLQILTTAENIRKAKIPSHNKSGVKGVYWYERHRKWHASFRYNYKRIFVGYFETLEEAEKALNRKREEVKNEFNS